jgi:predicted Zn-ribbon and HTH transcriptional regulator
MLSLFATKCPKCGSKKVKEIKESFFKKLMRLPLYLMFFITILFVRGKKPLLVCQDCGFSWEKR